jgi:mRNA interferase MazF
VEAPAAGAVVLVRFPFSDLSGTKLRPAVVLADAGRGDRVLCQVTSKPYGDPTVVPLDETAFGSGSLPVTSYARPGKLFTASGDLIAAQVGILTAEAMARIVDAVVALLKAGTGPLPSPEAQQ